MFKYELYVKSSALGQSGIHWRHIKSEDEQIIEIPDLMDLMKYEVIANSHIWVNDLIDEVKPSLLILRDSQTKKLLLEITGINSDKRSVKLGRKVLNTMVWITDDKEDNEKILRSIAFIAVQNILQKDDSIQKLVENSIDFYKLEEFKVDLTNVQQFIDDNLELADSQPYNDSQKYKIENKSTTNLEALAEDLKKYCLPKTWLTWDGTEKTDGVLVVVTNNLEQRTILHDASVWRGFATHVEEPERKLETISTRNDKIQDISSTGTQTETSSATDVRGLKSNENDGKEAGKKSDATSQLGEKLITLIQSFFQSQSKRKKITILAMSFLVISILITSVPPSTQTGSSIPTQKNHSDSNRENYTLDSEFLTILMSYLDERNNKDLLIITKFLQFYYSSNNQQDQLLDNKPINLYVSLIQKIGNNYKNKVEPLIQNNHLSKIISNTDKTSDHQKILKKFNKLSSNEQTNIMRLAEFILYIQESKEYSQQDKEIFQEYNKLIEQIKQITSET